MNLVQEAFSLYVETMPLETMDTEHPMFEELYEKECQIYVLFSQMTNDELAEYRGKVAKFEGDHN